MVLLIIFGVFLLLSVILMAATVDGESAFVTFFGAGAIFFMVWVLIQTIGSSVRTEVTQNIYSQPIVAIADGKGIQGEVYGGLFIMSGYINDTQHFAYYRKTGDTSFVLEKRDAGASTIHTDVAPADAKVDITDNIATCKPAWWLVCGAPEVTFAHADFHVPANSIKNEFNLDAQ